MLYLKEQLSPVTNQNILDIHEVVQEKYPDLYLELLAFFTEHHQTISGGKDSSNRNHRDGRPIHGLTKGNPLGST